MLSLPTVMASLLYLLYWGIRINFRTIGYEEVNQKLQMVQSEHRRRNDGSCVKCDKLRSFAEVFSWMPVSFALFGVYLSARNWRYKTFGDGYAYFWGLIVFLSAFVIYLLVYFFVVKHSKDADLLAIHDKKKADKFHVLYLAPVAQWFLIGFLLDTFSRPR